MVSGMIGAMGGAIIVGAIGLALWRWRFVASAKRAEAKVVDYEVVEDLSPRDNMSIGNGKFYHPVVELKDEHGRPQRVRTFTGSTTRTPRVGSMVSVLYDPGSPRKVEIESFSTLWGGPILFAAAGALFLFIAALSYF